MCLQMKLGYIATWQIYPITIFYRSLCWKWCATEWWCSWGVPWVTMGFSLWYHRKLGETSAFRRSGVPTSRNGIYRSDKYCKPIIYSTCFIIMCIYVKPQQELVHYFGKEYSVMLLSSWMMLFAVVQNKVLLSALKMDMVILITVHSLLLHIVEVHVWNAWNVCRDISMFVLSQLVTAILLERLD